MFDCFNVLMFAYFIEMFNFLILTFFCKDAVSEVKRQAVAELQKAVSVAESKASELVAVEKAKMEKVINDARRQAAEEALAVISHQDDSVEVC